MQTFRCAALAGALLLSAATPALALTTVVDTFDTGPSLSSGWTVTEGSIGVGGGVARLPYAVGGGVAVYDEPLSYNVSFDIAANTLGQVQLSLGGRGTPDELRISFINNHYLTQLNPVGRFTLFGITNGTPVCPPDCLESGPTYFLSARVDVTLDGNQGRVTVTPIGAWTAGPVGPHDPVTGAFSETFTWTRPKGAPKVAFYLSGAASLDNLAFSVPEPSTWALMLMGFGGLGGVFRRRRAVTA